MNELKQRFEAELEQLMLRVRGNRQYQQMLQAYLRLSARDRLAVNILTLLMAFYLIFSVILSPALKHLFTAEKNYQQQIENHAWMLEQQPIVKEMLATKPTVREGSLLSIASATAKQFDISFNRFEPVGEDKVRLRLDQVEFNSLVSWLGVLESDEGIVAVDISLDAASSGYVSVRLTIQG
jgi:general secretion pathway protein M